MARSQKVYHELLELRERYLRAARGKGSLLQLIRESEVSDMVYNSNAIENSTLSLDETERILRQIDLDRVISQKELFEARNLARIIGFIDQKSNEQKLDLDIILQFHLMLLSNINDEIAGRFRREKEWVRVGNYIAVDPGMVVDQLEETLLQFDIEKQDHIVQRIALVHLRFECIHPFVDGNGRIGRVLNNYLLTREGYVPINLKYADRKQYYKAFQEYDLKENSSIMETLIARALSSSYNKRLAYLESKNIIPLKKFAKTSSQSHSNLINKAKRQTIPAFWERGLWKIGI